jgi:hypothetical protein
VSGETGSSESGLTVDTLKMLMDERSEFTQQQIQQLRILLDERYATQTKALDAAFVAAEKAVSTALESADRAVSKAEIAAEKRFESVNEFRGQLADQVATFMSRTEATVRIDAIVEKLDSEIQRNQQRSNELELRLTSRLDLSEGNKQGGTSTMATVYLVAGLIISVIVAATIIMSR